MQENRYKNDHCRSPNPELDERSQSFTELKKIFQDKNLSHVPIKSYSSSDALDDIENKAETNSVKRKDPIFMTSHKSHSKKRISSKYKSKGSVLDQTVINDTQNPVQDINQELHDKLSLKKSDDKVSVRFSNGGSMKRKKKHKVSYQRII